MCNAGKLELIEHSEIFFTLSFIFVDYSFYCKVYDIICFQRSIYRPAQLRAVELRTV